MEQSDGCNPVLTTVTLCLFYHWMVIGVIMGFVFTLALEPEKIEKEDYFVLILGNLRRTEHFNGFLWGITVIGLSIQAVNVAASLKVFRAVYHNVPKSMSSGAVLLATSNAMEAIFGLAFVFVPPFLPKSITIPRLIWLAKLLISTPLAINVLYYANSKTEEIRVKEKERRRAAETDFPLVYVHPDDAQKEARMLVAHPVQTARTPALESTLFESAHSVLENSAASDGRDEKADRHGQANAAPESKAVEETKEKKLRGKTTFTVA
ncbi:uncharacterized protein [Dermacentor albipictus]|uniref:uncharacterized protein isoform X1 n=1 Tax=Dermacentor albipictus TaxID=60249 RepID=UPI0031FC7119